MGLEAFTLVDLLTRDRDFRNAIRQFNAQVLVLKYDANWLKPFDTGKSVDWWNHFAQIGGLVYNAIKFLMDAGYLRVYGELVKVVRPYWLPPAEWAIKRDFGKMTCEFIRQYFKINGKYPSLKRVAEYWRVPRYTLIEGGYTREVIYAMYKHYRKTHGEVKVIKLEKEYKMLSEQEQRALAEKITRRIFH